MVGERLAGLREKKNMTQEEFAEYMGVTRQSVSKWETNKAFPDVEKLIRISELYDTSIDYILKGTNQKIQIDDNEDLSSKQNDDLFEVEEEPEIQTGTLEKKRKGLMISIIITFFITLLVLVFLLCCIKQSSFGIKETEKTGARVEKVCHQLSLVEVGYYNEDGDYLVEKIILDDAGVRQGDYIYVDKDGDNIKIIYSAKTFVIPVVLLLLCIVMATLQIKELKYHE